ncbi:hypothetical protein AB3N62_10755 [Leptospira sp. WS4.C2]
MKNLAKTYIKDKFIYYFLFGDYAVLYYFGTKVYKSNYRKPVTVYYFAKELEYFEKYKDINAKIDQLVNIEDQDEFLSLTDEDLCYLHKFSAQINNRINRNFKILNQFTRKIRHWKKKSMLFESQDIIDLDFRERDLAMRGVLFYKTRTIIYLYLLRIKYLFKPFAYFSIFIWDNFAITFEQFNEYQIKKVYQNTLLTNKEYMNFILKLKTTETKEELLKKAKNELEVAQKSYFEINKSFLTLGLALSTILISIVLNLSEFISKKKELDETKLKIKNLEQHIDKQDNEIIILKQILNLKYKL